MSGFFSSFFEEQSPEDHISRALKAGIVCWVLTFLVAFFIPEMWVDLIILTVCLYGVSKHNKWAATFLFVMYTVSKVATIIATGHFSGIISVIFIYLFFRGMVAAFQLSSMAAAAPAPATRSIANPNECPQCRGPITANQNRCMKCGASLTKRYVPAA